MCIASKERTSETTNRIQIPDPDPDPDLNSKQKNRNLKKIYFEYIFLQKSRKEKTEKCSVSGVGCPGVRARCKVQYVL